MRISWSFMKAYERCPHQAQLLYIDKLSPELLDERRFIRGSTGHKFLESWAKKGFNLNITAEDAGLVFDALVKKKHIVWLHDKDEAQMRDRVIEDAAKIQSAICCHKLINLCDLQVEKWVSRKILSGSHELAGLLDMVADGGMWVIDTKMTTDSRWIDPNQLFFYGLLLGLARGRYPSRLSFFLPLMLSPEESLSHIHFSKAVYSRMQSRVMRVIKNIEAGEFRAIGDEETCKWCHVKKYCER